jgi:quercetin dioxygenase-like cupin family protein
MNKLLVSCLFLACWALGQEHGVVRPQAELKFAPLPGLPACVSIAVEDGDPTKGASIIAMKAATGCVIPWHWHTPNENVMIVSGQARFQMRGEAKGVTVGPGGFAKLNAKHVHQFTCLSSCTAFLYSDSAFDIHYVDEAGTEMSADQALKPVKQAKANHTPSK